MSVSDVAPPARPAAPQTTAPLEPVPRRGPLMGLDHGRKRVGVAMSNSDQTLAMPVGTWNLQGVPENARYLKRLLEDYQPVGLVLGLPLMPSGDESDQAKVVREFGAWLATTSKLPVAYWDERHTSTEAELLLMARGYSPERRKAKQDELAAQLILQAFLDAKDRLVKPGPLPGSGQETNQPEPDQPTGSV